MAAIIGTGEVRIFTQVGKRPPVQIGMLGIPIHAHLGKDTHRVELVIDRVVTRRVLKRALRAAARAL